MLESCPKKNIFSRWLKWHFFEVPKKILKVSRNFLVFNFNYFSVFTLLKTLFAPWRRSKESYGRGFDLKRYAATFIGNMISRILGLIVRIVIIVIGLIVEVFIFLCSIIVFFSWIFAPLIIFILISLGIQLM